MEAPTLTIQAADRHGSGDPAGSSEGVPHGSGERDVDIDSHFVARMRQASAQERDAVFADLAARALAGDPLATRTLHALLLPACQRIAAARGPGMVAAVLDAAYQEVLDWAAREAHPTR